jgi:glycosyltransferase involved in cell wall biosynthesis
MNHQLRPKIAVIIATYKREDSLLKVLQALENQTRKPEIVVIADASNGSNLEGAIASISMKVRVLNSKIASLTVQKNLALDYLMANWNGDFIQVLDDDTFPVDNYLEILSEFLLANPKSIGCSGYCTETDQGGLASKYRKVKGIARLKKILFWVFGLESFKPGSVTWGGVGIFANMESRACETEWLQGASMWRSWLFDHEKYHPQFLGSALAEDLEFSLRASAYGSMYALSDAHLPHGYSELNRPNLPLHYYRFARNRYFIYSNPSQKRFRKIGYYISTSFLSLAILLKSFLSGRDFSIMLKSSAALIRGMKDARSNTPPL